MFLATALRLRARPRLTRSGWQGLALCLAVALAAANTANNLLYLLLALLLAAYPVSAWMSWRAVSGLLGTIVAPPEVRAGATADVVVTLVAAARRAAGILVELRATEAAGLPAAAPSVGAVPCVAAGESASVALPATLAHRGVAQLGLVARSPFPFGIVEATAQLAGEEMLVLPQPDPSWRQAVPESVSEGSAAPRKGDGTDIFNIREYSWGEDARRMDWKASARIGKPMLRELAREQQRHAVLVVTPGPRPPRPRGTPAIDLSLERAVSLAAGAAEDLGREGWRLRLLAPGLDVRGDARAILRGLARVEAPSAALAAEWWAPRVAAGETVLEFVASDATATRVRGGVA